MAGRAPSPPEGLAAAEAAYPELARAALIDRRMALRLMAASAALAAANGCDSRAGRLTARPGPRPSGAATELRTTLDQNGLGFGVIVRRIDGRPVKIEGDPDHPASLGRSNVFAQAALLAHYDPARPNRPRIGRRRADWDRAEALVKRIAERAQATRGEGLHMLLQPTASPTLERTIALVQARLPGARFHGYRPIPLEPVPAPDLLGADIILSLGSDFLGPGPMQVRHAAEFMAARRRALDGEGVPPRLVVAESVPTLTGARADERLALDPAAMADFVDALAAAVAGDAADPWFAEFAARLRAAGPRAAILAGRSAPAYVAARAREIAAALGARSGDEAPPLFRASGIAPIEVLAERLDRGAVDTLVVIGGNPAYDAPAPIEFEARLRRAADTLFLGPEANETARACKVHLPQPGELARWGDLRAFDGSVSLVRPVAEGVGWTEAELLARLAGEPAPAEALVRATHGLADAGWEEVVATGALPAAEQPAVPPRQVTPLPARPSGEGMFLLFQPSSHVWDGSFADNAWTQELPDPITRLAWGNAATIAPETAAAMGLEEGDEVEIVHAGRRLAAPVKTLEGQAPGTVSLALGYGRPAGGVGGDIGANAYRLRDRGWIAEGAELHPTGGRGRLIEPNKSFDGAKEAAVRWTEPGAPPVPQLGPTGPSFVEAEYDAVKQWGMVIDLDACIGCNACTIACQAENNIPVVGPDEAGAGRVMHWIRVDRYPRGEMGEPQTAFQPVPCMHCETAPCEPVCPVGATTHSSEGINEMTYQRCIGTRSCSNNCPYKVRRFNWFDYQADEFGMPEQGHNPRVTVRESGVMEKCTYCVQRIEAVRTGEREGPPQTACQQACPTQAITFGDLADPGSEVSAARASPRNYALLDGLNLRPRTTYLARLRRGDG